MTTHREDTRDDAGAWDHVRAYDVESERPSEAVLHAVSETTGRDVLVGEPLYGAADPDALDSLVRTDGEGDIGVSFSYLGCFVSVDRRSVKIRRIDGDTPE